MGEDCVKIEIVKRIPFDGPGDSMTNRLRKVSLRGFPDVKIYENADFDIRHMSAEEIKSTLHIPQPRVYKKKLARISDLRELFLKEGIDILHLDAAYDFIAYDKDGVQTNWTMIPPVVEKFSIPKNSDGGFDYEPIMGEALKAKMRESGLNMEPELANIPYDVESSGKFNLINDGSHRIHCGVEDGNGTTVLMISGMTEGFPYYAVPQPYSNVTLMEKRDDTLPETKIHIVEAPGHKDLYRLFPSGGIMVGAVRSDPKLKDN